MLPELIVFDLDFTVWDCGGTWCDCLNPPFSRRNGGVMDSLERQVTLYQDVPEILDYLESLKIPMALASRTEQPKWARELLDLLELRERFLYEEIFPGSKVRHFNNLSRNSGLALEAMLFFDDEPRNLRDLEPMGVCCQLVSDGLNRTVFEQALARFA
ncbi:MAG: magnesium-dependent phosphatase-1 [Lutimaribacter sp.]